MPTPSLDQAARAAVVQAALTELATNALVDQATVCAAIGKSRSTVRRMAYNGDLASVNTGPRLMYPSAPLLRQLGREDLIPQPVGVAAPGTTTSTAKVPPVMPPAATATELTPAVSAAEANGQ